ncbi:PREDICTED: nucleoporin Nup43-like [Amphimedon queenslandica]|uniref:Uncharacterized protein n=1 Tax=Amphimedon queenslandica TaxID=400682 RepID=A0A1X7UZU8_AMPQE|nr:PREDICTED: nucleoporin Nup43-like [Amphimedon queenslandica]|eukprot:XP_019851438.1 PREDICTED: nucleoporin Nup43-like [Amphimedon queenslandica]
MSEPVLKYIGHKASKVRWEPVESIERGTRFVTGSYDDKVNKVRLYNYSLDDSTGSFNEPNEVSSCSVSGDVTDLLFIDRRYLLVALSNGSVSVIKNEDNTLCPAYEWKGVHCSNASPVPVTSITHYSLTNDDTVLTAGEDGRIAVLRLDKPTPSSFIDDKDSTSITSLISYYHSEVLAANLSGQLKLWDLRASSTAPAKTFPISSSSMVSVNCLSHHPNQSHMITAGCDNGSIGFLDLRQERIPISFLQGHTMEVWESRFHSLYPDNLISCSQDGSLLHWASLQRHYNRDPHHAVSSSSNDDHIWSHTAIAKGNFEATRLIPESNVHSVNSFDVSNKNCVVGVTDGEAMYVLPNIDCH